MKVFSLEDWKPFGSPTEIQKSYIKDDYPNHPERFDSGPLG
jgi:hypothetical protein